MSGIRCQGLGTRARLIWISVLMRCAPAEISESSATYTIFSPRLLTGLRRFFLLEKLWNRNFVSFHFICFCCWIDTIVDSMNLCRRIIFNFVVRRHWIDLPVSCRIHGRPARAWLMSCTIWLNSLIRFTFTRVGFTACQRFCTAIKDDLGEMDWCWRKEVKKRWFSSENSDEAGRGNLSSPLVCHARATDFRWSTRVNCIRLNFRGAFEVTSSYKFIVNWQPVTSRLINFHDFLQARLAIWSIRDKPHELLISPNPIMLIGIRWTKIPNKAN